MAKKGVSVKFTNADEVIKTLNNLKDIDKIEVIKGATLHCHAKAVQLCPRGKRHYKANPKTKEDATGSGGGGALAESIKLSFEENGANSVGKVYTNLEYAAYVEFGTGKVGQGTYPYEKDADMKLTYRQTPWTYTPDGGETFVRTSGMAARPYMYPALKSSEKYIKRRIAKDFQYALRKKLK